MAVEGHHVRALPDESHMLARGFPLACPERGTNGVPDIDLSSSH